MLSENAHKKIKERQICDSPESQRNPKLLLGIHWKLCRPFENSSSNWEEFCRLQPMDECKETPESARVVEGVGVELGPINLGYQ